MCASGWLVDAQQLLFYFLSIMTGSWVLGIVFLLLHFADAHMRNSFALAKNHCLCGALAIAGQGYV